MLKFYIFKKYLKMNLNKKKKKQFISLFNKRSTNKYFRNNRKIVLKNR